MIIREPGRLGRFGRFGEDGDGKVPWDKIIDAGGNVLSHLFDQLGPPDVINNTYTQAKPGMGTSTMLMIGGGAAAVVLAVVLATRR